MEEQVELMDVNNIYNRVFVIRGQYCCFQRYVIYMAGRKFGTDGNEWQTWAMNSVLPAFVADKFKKSNIVVFSSGNIYPIVPVNGGGCSEKDRPLPNGEYAMSCLARERSFEYAAHTFGTKIFTYRLNFAVDLRYGVLFDVANKIMKGGANQPFHSML